MLPAVRIQSKQNYLLAARRTNKNEHPQRWMLIFKKCGGLREVRTLIIESEYNFLPGYVRERVGWYKMKPPAEPMAPWWCVNQPQKV